MEEEDRVPLSTESLHEDIGEIKRQLCEIQRMVQLIAVQDERIKHVELAVAALGRKHDAHAENMVEMVKHQASCPREQIRWVWWVLVPQSLVLLGMLLAIFHRGAK